MGSVKQKNKPEERIAVQRKNVPKRSEDHFPVDCLKNSFFDFRLAMGP